MKTLIRLALRNIFRNRRRTLLTFFSMIAGVAAIIVFGGFVEYTFWGLRESTIKTQLGHIQLYAKGYSDKGVAQPGQYLLNNSADIVQKLQAKKGVQTVTRRLSASGLISTGEKTISCKIIGVEPEKESELSSFETIIDGMQLDSSNAADGGVVGAELIKALGAKVGDTVTILTTTGDGMLNAVEFKITGVGQTGSQDYDSVFVKLPLSKVQDLMGTKSVEKVVILLSNTDDLGLFIPILKSEISTHKWNVEIKTWDELAFFYHKVVQVYRGMFKVVNIIIGIVILLSVTNTMSMSIFERVREIGTLRALGTTQSGILKLFLMEGLLMGIIGASLGVVVGVGIANAINMLGGIYIPPPPGMSRGYLAFILTPAPLLAFSFGFMVIVTLISSLYPAYRASRFKIIDALGHV
ncbi:ABC transporter permease [bacterium]|nr:ABC transporter permease [bacterium]